jgi:hypothetical protein
MLKGLQMQKKPKTLPKPVDMNLVKLFRCALTRTNLFQVLTAGK